MRVLLATAGGLALMASSAAADTDTVTLNATVGDFIEITSTTDSTIGDLDITGGSGVGANNNATNPGGPSEKALFEVTSNVDYNIELDWETWQEASLTIPSGVPAFFEQANYVNSAENCSIGGIVSFDPDPSGGAQNDAVLPNSGATPLNVGTTFTPGIVTYGVNTEASPDVTNCTGGVAAPGTYSLDVEITVSKA